MILDALTRAEHERQLEKQPDLKFVSPVKQRQKKANNIWQWIALALIANAVVLAIFLRPGTNLDETTEIATNSAAISDADSLIQSPLQPHIDEEAVVSEAVVTNTIDVDTKAINSSPVDEEAVVSEAVPASTTDSDTTAIISSPEARPLAMELESKITPEIDRPLIYEAKQAKTAQQSSSNYNSTPAEVATASSPTKGEVAFSQTELSVDESAQAIANAPKLLIDQGETTPSIPNVPSLKDLPDSPRNNLSQYEINVHVFDDDPERRFVLINMSKYKEGEHIANNGPLVEEITRNGVIVDYGNGRALLPSK